MDNSVKELYKECYELAALFEESDFSREVLREKAKKVEVNDDYGTCVDETYSDDYRNNQGNTAYNRVAEWEYFETLRIIKAGRSLENLLDAANHLNSALSNVSDDPRFLILREILADNNK